MLAFDQSLGNLFSIVYAKIYTKPLQIYTKVPSASLLREWRGI